MDCSRRDVVNRNGLALEWNAVPSERVYKKRARDWSEEDSGAMASSFQIMTHDRRRRYTLKTGNVSFLSKACLTLLAK